MTRLNRGAVVAAGIAASLGAASAAMSVYWALGGTALLDIVGGEIESWGRERSASAGATLWLITIAKLAAAVAPLVLVGVWARRLPAWTRAQPMRVLGWVVAIGLTAYGSVLTVVGLLVEADVIDAADDADERAIAWHAFFGIVVRFVGRALHCGHVAQSSTGVRYRGGIRRLLVPGNAGCYPSVRGPNSAA